ncbi:MAG TPA: SDR family oxidoreductase [Thermomicrobiales bacterium]|nr:SDR family oxidoreductase [Thermomicrobiales bacterium]
MPNQTTPQDPKTLGDKPPFPEQEQPWPGSEAQMQPQPDYGEETYRGSGKLTGRVALVTGADSGIGRAVALAFAREGADVVISYLDEEEDAKETERVVTAAGRTAILAPGDIQDEQFCEDLVARTVRELGGIDILVNNAAYQSTNESIQELTTEEWHRALRTNLDAMFFLSRAALRHLRPGGSIINTTSIQAYQPSASLLHYATTKGGILTFTKALASEAISQGIRVNAVAPGPVWTPLIVSTIPAEQHAKFGQDSPMQRPAQPAELAPSYVFLASQDASYISGEVIGVTGGTPLA